jgi:hypothetical protein
MCDEMIPVSNSYRLAENLPNAVLLVYPDSGHGSLFQFHASFTRHAAAFLASDGPFAPYLTAPRFHASKPVWRGAFSFGFSAWCSVLRSRVAS